MKIRNKKVISVQDWDELVQETYGRPYAFQQQEGCKPRGTFELTIPDREEDYSDDTVPEIVNCSEGGVSFKAWLARDPKQKLDSDKSYLSDLSLSLWWTRNFYPHVQMVANDLYKKGLIKAGEYLIEIDW